MKPSSLLNRFLQGGVGATLLLFIGVLVFLLHGVFLPDQTLFSNDGPLGQLVAQCHQLPGRFTGCWADLNNVGFSAGAASPNISFALQWLLGPVWFSKLYAILALLILGMGAWCFFRQSRLSQTASVLGGLAAMLSSTYFSVACWGVAAHDITAGMFFLALAALVDIPSKRAWVRLVLAGMAVGMGVAEGADVGAIFSVFVAAFALYQACIAEGSRARNLTVGLGRLALVVVSAAFLAAQPVYSLTHTSIEGVAGAQQDAQTKLERWDWATQWSLPKKEMLGLLVPGLFGYRMDTQNGGNYWGLAGQDPAWERYLPNPQGPPPPGFLRYVGGGNYAGVVVVLLAIWTAAQSLRRQGSAFTLAQRKWLWFWLAVALVSILLALGRYAPFYQLAYALPYFSTIRNPAKFVDLFALAMVILFAFGVDGLQRQFMAPPEKSQPLRWPGLGSWWRRATRFEKYWVYGCGIVWVASMVTWLLIVWLLYGQFHEQLTEYLHYERVEGNLDDIANFSVHQAGWFVLFFFLAAGLMVLIFSRAFAGKRTGGLWLGLLLVADLGLANQPWIIYWNYPEKYASNPVLDVLKDHPYEHRVVIAPMTLPPDLQIIAPLYRKAWLQHDFPYHNIQSFDLVEMPRVPEDFSAFAKMINSTNTDEAFSHMNRAWMLTNTRYVLAPVQFGDFWNRQVEPEDALQKVMGFNIVPKPGIIKATAVAQLTAFATDSGPFVLFDFPGTLPRARLYSRWQVNTNRAAMLDQMFSPAFNPKTEVLATGGVPACPTNVDASPAAGAVDFVSYAPRDIVLKADAAVPAVLLLNDHFDPGWKVLVDGKPEPLLCCNYLMRGVYLLPGDHQVEFKFQPPTGLLYVSLSAYGLLLVCVCLSVNRSSIPVAATPPTPAPPPVYPPADAKREPDSRKKAGANRRGKA